MSRPEWTCASGSRGRFFGAPFTFRALFPPKIGLKLWGAIGFLSNFRATDSGIICMATRHN